MAIKVGINGFGRIGRLAARILLKTGYKNLELVALNSLANLYNLAHLLKYDSIHRTFRGSVIHNDNYLSINGKRIKVTRFTKPSEIPWKDLGVELVLETSGRYKSRDELQGHINAGAKKVIIGAPGKNMDGTFIMGVNHTDYNPINQHIISNGSCTTNCLAPVVKIIHDVFKIEYGVMTTIHAYTMNQRILDGSHKDVRRARAAGMSIIPTTTGAAEMVTEVIPSLKGKISGLAVRVPVPNVSLVDLSCYLVEEVTIKRVHTLLKEKSRGSLKGILKVIEIPLVSVDYISSKYSSIIDALLTQVINKRLLKIIIWYDNEMGFVHRLIDFAVYVASKL